MLCAPGTLSAGSSCPHLTLLLTTTLSKAGSRTQNLGRAVSAGVHGGWGCHFPEGSSEEVGKKIRIVVKHLVMKWNNSGRMQRNVGFGYRNESVVCRRRDYSR